MTASDAGYAGTSAAGLAAHYEVGNEFFRLWLGNDLIYSSALWSDDGGGTLEEGQAAKIDYFARMLRVQPGSVVVDVGCGWGGSLRRLVEVHGARAIGLTLSPAH